MRYPHAFVNIIPNAIIPSRRSLISLISRLVCDGDKINVLVICAILNIGLLIVIIPNLDFLLSLG